MKISPIILKQTFGGNRETGLILNGIVVMIAPKATFIYKTTGPVHSQEITLMIKRVLRWSILIAAQTIGHQIFLLRKVSINTNSFGTYLNHYVARKVNIATLMQQELRWIPILKHGPVQMI